MKTQSLKIKSSYDGLALDTIAAEPDDGKIIAVFQLVHGMAEMKERYLPFMEFLTKQGFACIIHDHRGHGQSVLSKEDLGYLYGGGGKSLVEDTYDVTKAAKARWPQLPLILFGHSMGSLIVRCYLKKHDDELTALIVCGSPCKNPAVGAGKAIAGMQKAIYGPRHKSGLLNKMSFGSYLKNIPDAKSEFAWLSVDTDNVAAYEKSEYCGFTFTVDGFQGLLQLAGATYDHKDWQVKNPKLPVLFISGKDDPCINGARNFKIAVDHMRSLGYSNVRGKMYDGGRHEILNDHIKETVQNDILKWMASQKLLPEKKI
jgi:alpha-beta hydrolase superfamily lysophospholipase